MDVLVLVMLCILCLLLLYLLAIILGGLFVCIGAIVYNINLYFFPKKTNEKQYNLETIVVKNPNGDIQLGIMSTYI
tara:strand:+ start:898 stop:1125 length:228 start_codon:yes stop_codon:yes gene_type:complete